MLAVVDVRHAIPLSRLEMSDSKCPHCKASLKLWTLNVNTQSFICSDTGLVRSDNVSTIIWLITWPYSYSSDKVGVFWNTVAEQLQTFSWIFLPRVGTPYFVQLCVPKSLLAVGCLIRVELKMEDQIKSDVYCETTCNCPGLPSVRNVRGEHWDQLVHLLQV